MTSASALAMGLQGQIWCPAAHWPELELSPSGLVGLLPLTCLSLLDPQGPHLGLASSLTDPPIGLGAPTEGAKKGGGQGAGGSAPLWSALSWPPIVRLLRVLFLSFFEIFFRVFIFYYFST